MSIGRLIVDLVANSGGFETDLGRAAKTAEKRANEINKSISAMGSKIKGAFATIGVGLTLGTIFNKLIDETSAAEKSLAALGNAVKNNAGAAGQSTQGLVDLSTELQKLTTFSDESVQGVSALLLSFRQIGGTEFKAAQMAVLDLATALGKDLNSSALLVGRALADPVKGMTALARAGVVLSKSQQDLIKDLVKSGDSVQAQGILLKALESRFGGAAEAAKNTLGGALAGLKNAFGDLFEVSGGQSSVLTDSINELTKILSDPEVKAGISTILGGLLQLIALAPKAVGAISSVFSSFVDQVRGGNTEIDLTITKIKTLEVQLQQLQGGQNEFEKNSLARRIAALRSQLDTQSGGSGPSTRGRGRPATSAAAIAGDDEADSEAVDKARESIEKLIATQQQQVAVYEKSAAATIAYRISQGDLADEFKALGSEADPLAAKLIAVTAQMEALQNATKQTEAVNGIRDMVAALQQEVDLMGASESEILAYSLAHGDLAKQFAAAGAGADQYRQQLISLTSQLQLMKDVQEGVDESLADFAAANEASLEQFSTSIGETFQEATDEWTVFKDQAARNTQDIIADTLTNGFKDGTDGILKSFADLIVKLTAQAVAADLSNRLFNDSSGGTGTGGGWLSALAGLFTSTPARATGGPVNAGTMYRVNEREPEYFKPNVGGKVVPLSKMSGGGAPITNHFTIQAPQGTVSRQTEMQISAAASRSLAQASRRNN